MAISRFKGVMQVQGTTDALTLQTLMNTASAGVGDNAVKAGVNYVEIQAETAVRFTVDGTTPTSTVGMIAVANTIYPIESTLDKIRIIGAQKVNVMVGFKSLV